MRPRGATQHARGQGGTLAALATAAMFAAAAAVLSGCATLQNPVPRCGQPLRLAIVAQSVPGAAYVPCIRQLPQGWSTSGFTPVRGSTSFLLNSDRAPGKPVKVTFTAGCKVTGASPVQQPRAPGVLTYLRPTSISPRVTGSLYDVFPGGCVSYSFDFTFGPHIALLQQFENAVGLYPRQQLRLIIDQKLGVELDP